MNRVNLSVLFFVLMLGSSHAQLDSIYNSLNHLTDSQRIDSMTRLARLDAIEGNGVEAIEKSRWALNQAVENGFRDLIPKARFYLASGFDEASEADSAIFHYYRVINELPGTKMQYWLRFAFKNLSLTLRQKGEYDKALEYQLKALELSEKEKDTLGVAEMYSGIGYTYDRMNNFKKAIEWHKKALPLCKLIKDNLLEHFIFGRIGIAYDEMRQYDSAHHYNQLGLRYFEKIGDSASVGMICSNIGNTYTKQRKWEQAEEYVARGHRIGLIYGNNGDKAISAINLGEVHRRLGHFEQSKQLLQEGVKYAKAWSGMKFLSEAYYGHFELYDQLGICDSALYYYQLYNEIKDSLYNLEKTKQFAELNTRYETQKKEQQIQFQQLEIQQKEDELLARRRLIEVLVLLFITTVILGFLFYQRYRSKKNAEIQELIIKEQKKGLEAVIHAQEEERKRISKDLHDGIGQQLSGLKMAFQKLAKNYKNDKSSYSDEFEKLGEVLSDSADEVRAISHQMMPKALTELGLIEAIGDMLKKSLGLNEIEYHFEHFGIDKRLNERIEISLYRVTQELINNIIKHSNATNVSIQLFKNQNKAILIIEDNGIGLRGIEGDGHGLLNIKSRINTLNGEMNLEPSPNSGTLATVRVPIS